MDGAPGEDPMVRRVTIFVLLLSGVVLMSGCGGDAVKQVMGNAESKAKVLDVIAADGAMTGQLLETLMGDEATRGALVDKVLANGETARMLMTRIARDQTMMDGILSLAAVDPTMHAHVMGVLQGMKMAGPAK
jgi:hypothetical protein